MGRKPADSRKKAEEEMRICCLGDSLTEGDYGIFGKSGVANVHKENYPFFLGKFSGCEVVNYGQCGYDATAFLKYYNTGSVEIKNADVIIILLGTNGGLDPKKDTVGNRDYIELIKNCRRDAPGASIVLCTPPHVTENPLMSNFGYAEQVKKAVSFVKKVADDFRLPLADLAGCGLFTAENEPVMQANDGLHFTEKGYETMAGFLYEFLKSKGIL